jgi:hypothetical protein
VAAFLPVLAGVPAQADTTGQIVTVRVGSGWHEFAWGEEGNIAPFFHVVARHRMRITLTDVGCPGEYFTVFRSRRAGLGDTDRSRTLAQSSIVVDDCEVSGLTGDPDVALQDPRYSHASFVVAPGRYYLWLGLPFNPFREGNGYIRFDRARPCHR